MQSKFKLLALVLLSTTFFLTSCGDSSSNPTTPSNQVTDNSTNKPSVPSVNTDSNVTEYSSFPYADIATFFNLISVTNNQIPSFDIASDESYYGYTSESESSREFVVYGTIGNVAGSLFNYGVGHMGKVEWIERYLHVSKEKLDKAEKFMGGHGAWMGFFAFIPLLGSAITILLGLMKANFFISLLSITIGKFGRYLILVYGAIACFK